MILQNKIPPRNKRHRSHLQRKLNVSVDACSPLTLQVRGSALHYAPRNKRHRSHLVCLQQNTVRSTLPEGIGRTNCTMVSSKVPRPARTKKRLIVFNKSLENQQEKGKGKFYFYSAFLPIYVFVLNFAVFIGRILFSIERRNLPRLVTYVYSRYALKVLNDVSTFLEITFLTASISVEIAFSSVSNCFNLNSKSLSCP